MLPTSAIQNREKVLSETNGFLFERAIKPKVKTYLTVNFKSLGVFLIFLSVIALALAILPITPAYCINSNFALGFRPGGSMNGADFGLRIERIQPFVGADLFWLNVKFSSTDNYYDEDLYWGYWSTERIHIEGSALLLIPHIGLKWYPEIINRISELNTYIKSSYFFSVPSVSISGERILEDRYGREYERYDLTPSEKDAVNDLLSFGGLELCFGSEYKFSFHFSLGAEFGVRLIWNDARYADRTGDRYNGYSREDWKTELNSIYRFTFTALTLNFLL